MGSEVKWVKVRTECSEAAHASECKVDVEGVLCLTLLVHLQCLFPPLQLLVARLLQLDLCAQDKLGISIKLIWGAHTPCCCAKRKMPTAESRWPSWLLMEISDSIVAGEQLPARISASLYRSACVSFVNSATSQMQIVLSNTFNTATQSAGQ